MFRVLIVHDTVVRHVVDGNELAVGADGRALPGENIVLAHIVPVAVEHFLSRGRRQPGGQLLREKLELGHRPSVPQAVLEKLLLYRSSE